MFYFEVLFICFCSLWKMYFWTKRLGFAKNFLLTCKYIQIRVGISPDLSRFPRGNSFFPRITVFTLIEAPPNFQLLNSLEENLQVFMKSDVHKSCRVGYTLQFLWTSLFMETCRFSSRELRSWKLGGASIRVNTVYGFRK